MYNLTLRDTKNIWFTRNRHFVHAKHIARSYYLALPSLITTEVVFVPFYLPIKSLHMHAVRKRNRSLKGLHSPDILFKILINTEWCFIC